jgi:outer membrane protein assembly factor BamD (BamD/ComL family)
MKSKKLLASIIIGAALVVSIPVSVYGYSFVTYNKLYAQGEKYLDEGKFDEAINSFNSTLKYKPKNGQVIADKVVK